MASSEPFTTFVTGLPSVVSINGTVDLVYVLQGGVSKKATASQLITSLAPVIATVRSSSATTVTASATTDYFLALDPTANAITVNLPASPQVGLSFLIKDATGNAATHNITIVPASGNIDGAANLVFTSNFQSAAVTFTGSQWSIN